MPFNKEIEFEKSLIRVLSQYGWEEVIYNPTEEDLLNNWASILFNNNREQDRLNNQPLTSSEMQQIIDQINFLRTPLKLNTFINGKTISIKRDNPRDTLHNGKEVSLKIYDRQEIAAGQSRYQIAVQPEFITDGISNNRRGDLMLLINGMPVIHIELKKSGIPLTQATNQISKYLHEKVFRGIYSLVQIFVAMTPEEMVYFANTGEDYKLNSNYFFHWADFNNNPINEWRKVAATLLSIPMAHQLIGFYTVADNTDGVLKVLRSYQYYAANAISTKVTKTDWSIQNKRGGYIWHTTGSGKTMTSFKSAELISNTNDADKVIFLVDRIELGNQSLDVYQNLAENKDDVQATENTKVLATKLKSSEPKDRLIVTSIQKMSRISLDSGGLKSRDIELMQSKRIVFIIDECHRSTFGDMLYTIKTTFNHAIYFGFTGTPIFPGNEKNHFSTVDVFGDELHRYTIADGINDKNVLGFDPYKVSTFKDQELKQNIALKQANASSELEVFSDKDKEKIYYDYMNKLMPSMYHNEKGDKVRGIESYIPRSQYETQEHKEKVVENILENWRFVSRNSKFHAIFATSSIKEAIEYYNLFQNRTKELKVTGLFDISTSDNDDGVIERLDGAREMLETYNKRFNQTFTMSTWDKYKKDISARLAHKEPYINIDKHQDQQLDLLIVVNQMLTGYDSKWINALYVDKVLKYENIIQSFSRTNRLFGSEKPFGTIKYYRYPHTMELNIKESIKLYSGERPFDLFVDKIDTNILKINNTSERIFFLFENENRTDLSKLPKEDGEQLEFARLFRELNKHVEAAKIQGFEWGQTVSYDAPGENSKGVLLLEEDYQSLLLRYKELGKRTIESGNGLPFDIEGYLYEKPTGEINAAFMNSNFEKHVKSLEKGDPEAIEQTSKELHSSFSILTKEEQKYAGVFLLDYQMGNISIDKGKTFRDYITDYMVKAKKDQINKCATIFGINEETLRNLINMNLNYSTINEFGRFDALKKEVNRKKAKEYFDKKDKSYNNQLKVGIKLDKLLRKFIINGGFELD